MLRQLIQWLAVACVFAVTALPWNPRRYLVPSDFMNLPKSRIRKDWLTHLLGALTIAFPLFYTSSSCATLITVSAKGDGVFARDIDGTGVVPWRTGAKFSFTYDDSVVPSAIIPIPEGDVYLYDNFVTHYSASFESKTYALTAPTHTNSEFLDSGIANSGEAFGFNTLIPHLGTFIFQSFAGFPLTDNFFSGDLGTIDWDAIVDLSYATFSDSTDNELFVRVNSIAVTRQQASVPNPSTTALWLIGFLGFVTSERRFRKVVVQKPIDEI